MFGELVVGYLFLGGAGAGGCLTCALLGLLADREELAPALAARFRTGAGRRWTRLLAPALTLSVGCLVLGIVCLAADLGRPDRLLLLMVSATPSYISFGAWALVACTLLGAALVAVWRGAMAVRGGALAALEALTVVAALATAAYTGLLLASMPSVPLWCTPWLPVLFTLSAASCGIALVMAAAWVSGAATDFGAVLARLALADAALIALEAVAAAGALLSAWASSGAPAADLAAGLLAGAGVLPDAAGAAATPTAAAARASVLTLTAGPDAWLFWGGFGLAGLAAPLALDLVLYGDGRRLARRAARAAAPRAPAAVPRTPASAPPLSPSARALTAMAAAACVLVGGLLLRVLVVGAGLHPLIGAVL